MHKITMLSFFLTLFGCSNNQKVSDKSQRTENEPQTYPIKPLQVNNGEEEGLGADIRLSITSKEENDTTKIYKAVSTHEGKEVGLLIAIPKSKEGTKGFGQGIVFKSIGVPSDNLLSTLAKLYQLRIDTVSQFTPVISINYVNLKEFANSLGDEAKGPYTVASDYKLFFEEEDDYAELYLNINPQENWIELREKDEEYRPKLIKFLRK